MLKNENQIIIKDILKEEISKSNKNLEVYL